MLIIFIILSIVLSLVVLLNKNRFILASITSVYTFLLAAISVYAFIHINEMDSLFFKFDPLGVILAFVLAVLVPFAFYFSSLYIRRHSSKPKHISIYYAALIMLITAMICAYFAENFGVLWVSIEATTLFVSVLVFFDRTTAALEAAWKYLFVSSFGLAIAFTGILFLGIIASNSGITNLSMAKLLSVASVMDTLWLKISFLLIFTGFSIKLSVIPLFAVAIDAKTIAPSPVNALMSTALVNVGFVGVFRIYTIIAHTGILVWAQHILLIAGIVSIFIAAIQMLRVKRLKRLYAFSSMEHMGIVLVGMAVGGVGYYAAILHLVFHSFVKAGLFFQIGQIRQFFTSFWLKDSGHYFRLNPIGALALILGTFSILAIPPSGLFVSEFMMFKAMFLGKQYVAAILILCLLTVIIYVFIKFIFHLLFAPKPDTIETDTQKISPYESIAQFALFSFVIYLGIHPPYIFTDLIHAAVGILM